MGKKNGSGYGAEYDALAKASNTARQRMYEIESEARMTDRDQVAREVLTEAIEHMAGRDAVVAAHELTKLRDERYPAPAAPVTVTLGGRTYTELASRWDANELWVAKQSELGLALSRIASDARRIEELERECDRLQSFITVAHSERDAAWSERDEARRLYRESEAALALANDNTRLWRERVTTGLGASTTEEGHVERSSTSAPAHTATSQGEGQQSGDGVRVAPERAHGDRVPKDPEPMQATSSAPESLTVSPAPIPLGGPRKLWLNIHTTGEVYAHTSEDSARWARSPQMGWETVPVVEAVADAATVERVARAILDNDREQLGPSDWEWNVVGESVRGSYLSNARAALRALGYTIQEGA